MALPSPLRFGVATSGFQIEGGYNQPGGPANNWHRWERSGRVPPSGRALDFWNRYEEVLDRAVDAGCDTFRLSVEWARCEPAPDRVDEAAFARYRAILEACHRRRLEPVVTLHHFTHPSWLGEDFWLGLQSPERFAAWAGLAVERLGVGCRHWLTVNEMNVIAFQAYFTGAFPPGRIARAGDVVRAIGHLLTAHVLAYRAIHRRQPEAVVSTNNHAHSVYELDRLVADVLLARSHGVARHELPEWLRERRRAFHHGAQPTPSRLERFMRTAAASVLPLDQAVPRAVTEVYQGAHERPLDVVAFNYYDPVTSHRLGVPGRRTSGGRAWSPFRQLWDDAVHPEGLATFCGLNAEPGMDLWVAENGLCNRVRDGRSFPRRDGWDRVRYLRAHLAVLAGVVAAGVPVTRYYHWTLADNYEWGSYEHRFGLHAVDPRTGVWSERDAFGGDAAGTLRALVEELRSGDPAPVG